jgi:hypothetical protein
MANIHHWLLGASIHHLSIKTGRLNNRTRFFQLPNAGNSIVRIHGTFAYSFGLKECVLRKTGMEIEQEHDVSQL